MTSPEQTADSGVSSATAALPVKDQKITLLWQGQCDGTNEGFEINGMLVIPSLEGVTYVRREDAIAFFGLCDSAAAQPNDLRASHDRLKAALRDLLIDDVVHNCGEEWCPVKNARAALESAL